MTTINALKVRNQFGEVLEMLDRDKGPILITKSKKVRAVLIRFEDYKTRFLDKQIEEEQELFYKQIKSHVAPSLIPEDPIVTLRKLRGHED